MLLDRERVASRRRAGVARGDKRPAGNAPRSIRRSKLRDKTTVTVPIGVASRVRSALHLRAHRRNLRIRLCAALVERKRVEAPSSRP